MIAEKYLSRSRLYRDLRNGPHGELVERYAARLVEDGLARHGTWRCLNVFAGLLSWMASRRARLSDLDEHGVERYLRHRERKQTIQPGDRAALKRWLSVLRNSGAIAAAPSLRMTSQARIFEAFAEYLRAERGLAPRSIIRYLPIIRRSCTRCALLARMTWASSVRMT